MPFKGGAIEFHNQMVSVAFTAGLAYQVGSASDVAAAVASACKPACHAKRMAVYTVVHTSWMVASGVDQVVIYHRSPSKQLAD